MIGKAHFKEVEVVVGGIMGSERAIVIDDIHKPSYIIGVADGKGFLKNSYTKEDKKNVDFMNLLINPK
jgi:hypothetical protein